MGWPLRLDDEPDGWAYSRRTILETFPIISYTEQTAYVHARVWAELEAAGKTIGFYDLIVGATALERGSRVATFNKRHFAQIKNLGVVEPL
jgi:predicted nucleic acid-binding protein